MVLPGSSNWSNLADELSGVVRLGVGEKVVL